jgi:signal transduction histidine kinase
MVDDFTASMAFMAKEKALEFICVIDPGVNDFYIGDPGKLRQILTNLVGNAFKFTSEGKVSIYVKLESETYTDNILRFSIKDTGVGIAEKKQDNLFKSFTQADTSTTREYGGTGLGLTISKQLSELMGGNIHFESEEGKGSIFTITFPHIEET